MMIKDCPILITGCPRSGTSLTAGIINKCEAWGGEMVGPTPHNPKGFFENIGLREKLTKPVLSAMGCDPLGQGRFPRTDFISPVNNCPTRQEWRESVFDILEPQGLTDRQWFYKDAKLCLIWPLWAAAFPKAKWIIVRRRDHEIVKSCINTPFMSAYDSEIGWLRMINNYLAKFQEMYDSGLQIREVWPEKIIKGDYSEIFKVVNWLGLPWNEKNVTEFVEPAYWSGAK